jgi:hypothetical protein
MRREVDLQVPANGELMLASVELDDGAAQGKKAADKGSKGRVKKEVQAQWTSLEMAVDRFH